MATHTKETLLAIVEKIRYDTTNIQMNVSELARAIANLPIPEPKPGQHKCPHDQLAFPSQTRLAEHLADVHGDTRAIKAISQRENETPNYYVGGAPGATPLNSEVALSHAHAAEADLSPAGSDVSKLTCRDEEVGDD